MHLLRDLHELKEQCKEHSSNEEVLAWAGKVRKLYERGQEMSHSEREHGPPSEQHREFLYIELVEGAAELAREYASAKEHREHPCHTLAKRLLLHLDAVFQFVLTPGLSADNNLAERSIRPIVVMRKVSGGSQSPKGSATRMTLASLFGTWRAKGLNPFTECFLLLALSNSQPQSLPFVPIF